jgi:hypothetical protein
MAKETVLVIGVSHYKFPDEQTQEIREGAHVHYLCDYVFDQAGKKGCFPVKISIPLKPYEAIADQKFPAICDLVTKTIPDGKGRPMPTVVGIEYVGHAEIFETAFA